MEGGPLEYGRSEKPAWGSWVGKPRLERLIREDAGASSSADDAAGAVMAKSVVTPVGYVS